MTPYARRTDAANDDLRSIALRIGVEQGRPIVAEQVIDDLIDCCDRLAQLAPISRLGTSKPHLGVGVRVLSHERWAILFRDVDDGVLILRIADGSQAYEAWRVDEQE